MCINALAPSTALETRSSFSHPLYGDGSVRSPGLRQAQWGCRTAPTTGPNATLCGSRKLPTSTSHNSAGLADCDHLTRATSKGSRDGLCGRGARWSRTGTGLHFKWARFRQHPPELHLAVGTGLPKAKPALGDPARPTHAGRPSSFPICSVPGGGAGGGRGRQTGLFSQVSAPVPGRRGQVRKART